MRSDAFPVKALASGDPVYSKINVYLNSYACARVRCGTKKPGVSQYYNGVDTPERNNNRI
jgi:hypothetical protein